MDDLKKIRDNDPIKRMVEKQTEQEELSPMDPPDAYEPPNVEAVPYEEMAPFLQKLMDDHKEITEKIDAFEDVIVEITKSGVQKSILQNVSEFFSFLDNKIVEHHSIEERILFPVLQERLLEKGEHSKGETPKTAIDMLEDDHVKAMQIAAVTFNFMGLASRVPDPKSQLIIMDASLEQAKALIELMKLHIFREDNIVFSLAQNFLSKEELAKMKDQLTRFASV